MKTDIAAMSKRMPSPVCSTSWRRPNKGLWVLNQVVGGGRGVVGFCCTFVLFLPPAALICLPHWPVVNLSYSLVLPPLPVPLPGLL